MLQLISNPVETISGVVQNIFAGFRPVIFEFKRQDIVVSNIGEGSSSTVLLTVNTDLSSVLSVGDSVYIYAEGLTYTYDSYAEVLEIGTNTVRINLDFIETSPGGYMNYLKNWYLEAKLVRADNTNVSVIPFSLKQTGNGKGEIELDVSIANDKNDQVLDFQNGVIEDSRIKFKVKYRQVYSGSSESFTTIDNEVILVFATENPDYESFLQSLDEPKIYKGYPFLAIFSHSDENNDDTGISINYDELDINEQELSTDNSLQNINAENYGFIGANLPASTSFTSGTEFIKFNADFETIADFDSNDFSDDFNI